MVQGNVILSLTSSRIMTVSYCSKLLPYRIFPKKSVAFIMQKQRMIFFICLGLIPNTYGNTYKLVENWIHF